MYFPRPLKVLVAGPLMAIALMGSPQTLASSFCSWDLQSALPELAGNRDAVWEAAVRLERCDVVGLSGIPSAQWLDAVQLELSAMGETWLQTAPRPDAPGKAFLWKANGVDFSGAVQSYPSAGGALSARFATADGEPFVIGLATPPLNAPAGSTVNGFLSHIKTSFPEAPSRWLVVTSVQALGEGKARAELLSTTVDLTRGVMTSTYKEAVEPVSPDVMQRIAAPVSSTRTVLLGPVGSRLPVGARGPAAVPAQSKGLLGDQNILLVDIGTPGVAKSNERKDQAHFVADTLTSVVVASTCRHASLVPAARAIRYPTLEEAVSRGYQRMSCDDFGVLRAQLGARS